MNFQKLQDGVPEIMALLGGEPVYTAFYNMLNLHVSAPRREVIRATRDRLKPALQRGPEYRTGRHALIRRMIEEHEAARSLYSTVMGGHL